MNWSDSVLLIPGKSDRSQGTTLPLVQHLIDAADVAGVLWDRWVAKRVRDAISAGFGGCEADARQAFVWLASVHDLGKATPAFCDLLADTSRMPTVVAALERAGFDFPARSTSTRGPRHEKLSVAILSRWLKGIAPQANPYQINALAGVVGMHHGSSTTSLDLQAIDRWIGPGTAWTDAQEEIATKTAQRAGVIDHLPRWLQTELPMSTQVLLAGLIVVADWLASDTSRFPFLDVRPPNLSAGDVVTDWDLPSPWQAGDVPEDAAVHLGSRFPNVSPAMIRRMQRASVEVAQTSTGPTLLVLEAGMGTGKTEAALLAAEVLAQSRGCGGVVFALPTQATSDGILPRLVQWVERLPGRGATSVGLAHGRAALNADFQRLVRRRVMDIGSAEEGAQSTLTASATAWLKGRRKATLANFVVCTIDQVLFLGLQTRHVPLRHAAFAGKVVILDEVHAADTYMQVYLERALTWLAAHGATVVMLSATLPPETRQSLVSAWCDGAQMPPPTLGISDIYPRITRIDATGELTVSGLGDTTAPAEVSVSLTGDDEAFEALAAAVNEGACVGLIRNTVAQAQAGYDWLVARLGDERVRLIHSSFVAVDRQRIETNLRSALGKPGADGVTAGRPRGLVVVGTQILEQSLDIDLDLLVTDIAPIDLMLQRIGRLHRHIRGVSQRLRPPSVRQPRVLIIGASLPAPPRQGIEEVSPWVAPHTLAVYDASLLLRSLALLQDYLQGRPLRLPDDIASLVRRGYDPHQVPPQGWEAAWAHADAQHRLQSLEQRAKAKAFLLPRPDDISDFREWTTIAATDPDESASARAQVRDTEDTVEVVVVCREGPALRGFPGSGIPPGVDLACDLDPPTDDVARKLAACTLRLPTAMTASARKGSGGAERRVATAYARIDAVIADLERQGASVAGWQESAWLRGQLPLILDESGRAEVAGWALEYDTKRGLRRTRLRKDRS